LIWCLSIKDEFGPFKPFMEIKYIDMVPVVNSSLNARLSALNIKRKEQIISKLLRDLEKNQSMFTFD
jgi:hypothetical protein